jgi:hypothetical protein
MSQENVELVRPLLAEWAEGNFWGGAELMAPNVTFRAAPPANFVAHGREEAARQMLRWTTRSSSSGSSGRTK